MSKRCPQDGGFIGEAGCSHPNHEHSVLVKRLLESAGNPYPISVEEANAALKEGFFVEAGGKRIGFGSKLSHHFDVDHDPSSLDIKNRKEHLMFAISTVKTPDSIEHGHRGIEKRTAYIKSFQDFGILAISEKDGNDIEMIFDIIPKRALKRFAAPHPKAEHRTAESKP